MVKWSPVRCSFYFQKSCNMPFHSISVCVSTEHPRSNTISGSIFMLYDIFHLDGFLYLFSNIKSDLKPLRNIVWVLGFQKKFFFFFPNAGRERRASCWREYVFSFFEGWDPLRVMSLCFSLCSGLRFCVLSPIRYWYQNPFFPNLYE